MEYKYLVFKSFRSRKFISFLCIISIALSVSLFFTVNKIREGVETSFTNSISHADLIVGARSGPLQLLLYSIFNIGSPTNNISFKTYEKIKNMSSIDWTIPISLGDSFKGFRVVATNDNFIKHYKYNDQESLLLDKGKWSYGRYDVVLGSHVARKLNLKITNEIILSHGMVTNDFLKHDDNPFVVVGILNPTGTPIDKSLYITLEGMEAMHIGFQSGYLSNEKKDAKKEDLKPNQITAFILKTKSRIALLGLQRFISNYKKEALSAIIPGMVLAELWSILDSLEIAFQAISFFVIVIGCFSIMITLYISLNERQKELAILRSLGVSLNSIVILLILEAFILSVLGVIFGFALHCLSVLLTGPLLQSIYGITLNLSRFSYDQLILGSGFILLGTAFGILPAIKAYKISSLNALLGDK